VSPQDYYTEVVEPSWQKFTCAKSSRRLAAQVAILGYRMVDCIARQRRIDKNDKVIQKVEQACPAFKVIQDIANSFKHSKCKLAGKKHWPHLVDDVLTIELDHSEPFSNGTFFTDGTGWHSDEPRVNVMASDKRRHDLEYWMARVIETWKIPAER
jgi:hypothetical protein